MAQKKNTSTVKSAPKTKARKAPVASNPATAVSEEEIAQRAYALWESRGKPIGSPEEDWHRATEELLTGTRERSVPT